jgi:hypothetical protein
MPVDPSIFDAGVFDLGRRVRAGVRLVRNELRAARRGPFGLTERVQCVRRGFTSNSAALYGLNEAPDPKAYISEWHEGALGKRPNRRHGAMFDDKLTFYYTMLSLSPYVIPVRGIAVDGRFTPIAPSGVLKPLVAFLRELGDAIVLKPNFGTHGDGVIFLEPGLDGLVERGRGINATTAENIVGRIGHSEYIVAPRIRQAAYAEAIFPSSTNTVRVMTMLDPDSGRPFVPICVHRFGSTYTAPIDAFAKGGLVSEIDLDTGRLGPLIAMPKEGVRTPVDTHPDTGVRTTGQIVPHFHAMIKHLLEVAERLPFLPYLGWDVIVSDEGFHLNEANVQPSIKLLQACRPILNDPRVVRFFSHHAVI